MKLGINGAALAMLEEVLETGFDDFTTIKKDSTLSQLGPDLDKLIAKYKKKSGFKIPFL